MDKTTTATFQLLGRAQQILAYPSSRQHLPGRGPSTALLHPRHFSSTQPDKPYRSLGTKRGNNGNIAITQYYQLTILQCTGFRELSVQHPILKTIIELKNKNNKAPVSISDSLGKRLAMLRFYKVFTSVRNQYPPLLSRGAANHPGPPSFVKSKIPHFSKAKKTKKNQPHIHFH